MEPTPLYAVLAVEHGLFGRFEDPTMHHVVISVAVLVAAIVLAATGAQLF